MGPRQGRPPLGPVWSFPSAGRRLARHLAARPNHPSTSSTREIRPHTDAPHQTPPGRPTGDDAKLQTGPRAPPGARERARGRDPHPPPGALTFGERPRTFTNTSDRHRTTPKDGSEGNPDRSPVLG
ncbi:hypothetical protein CP966_11230 [Streptomyces galilaeus]|nr:hypothetical protein CP966_11230 [Streptomyces galilaeus]